MITVLEMGAARHFLRTQQLARTAEERAQILQPTLEINAGCVCGQIVLGGEWEKVGFCPLLTALCFLTDTIWSRSCSHWRTQTLSWLDYYWSRYCAQLFHLFALCPFFPLMISKPKKPKNAISQFLTLSLYLEEQKWNVKCVLMKK